MFPWLRTAGLWVAGVVAAAAAVYVAAPYVMPQMTAIFGNRDNGHPTDGHCLNVTGTFHFNPSPIANPNGNGTVTLTGGGPAGFSSTRVTVRSLTPGVSVVSAAEQSFPLGQINGTWALTGMTPGQFITLSIDAVSPGHGSKPGTDECCSTTIYLQVPGDINLAVQKTTSMTPDSSDKGGGYQFTLRATNTAAPIDYHNVAAISDIVPAGLEFTSASGPNWNCGPSSQYPIAAGGTLTCVYTGPVPIATGAVLPPIKVGATVVGKPTDTIENCATIAPQAASGYIDTNAADNTSCTDIFPQFRPHDHVPPFKPKCGMDVLFVVDESYSIYDPAGDGSNNDQSSYVTNALVGAAHAFAGDGTNANARVIFFGTTAGFGGWGAWQPLTAANANNIAAGYNPSAAPFGFDTNWDAALRLAYTDLQAHGQPNGPVLVVFITDGRPNYFVDPVLLTNVAAAAGSAGEVDATNHATYAVDNIYTLNDKIIGIGIGPFMTNPPQPNAIPNGTIHLQNLLGGNAPPVNAGNPFNPSTGNVIVSGTYGTLSNTLLGLAGAACPNIQLSKSGSQVLFGPADFGTDGHLNASGLAKLGNATITLSLANLSAAPMTGIQVKDVLPGLPKKLSNPTAFAPPGASFTTSGGRDTVVWDAPASISLAAFNTPGYTTSMTFQATLDQAWVEDQYNNHTPADGFYYYDSVQNYAQVTHLDQTVGSTPNNMASPDGPVHELDEATAAVTIGTMKTCVPTQANNNCQPPAPGPYLQVKKVFNGDQEHGCDMQAPCTFTVTVMGDYIGPVAFGDGMFNGPHTTLNSTSTPLGLSTTATAVTPPTETEPLCASSSPASHTGGWFCNNPSFPANAVPSSTNPNIAATPYSYSFTVSFVPTAAGNYTNCFFAMMWMPPWQSGPAPTSFQDVYTAGTSPSVPYWGANFGDRGACADAHTNGYSGMRPAPHGHNASVLPPCDPRGGPVQGLCKPVCKDGTHWNGKSCLACAHGTQWDDAHGRCMRPQVCDESTTTLQGGTCACRYDGMIRRSQTMCRCPLGSTLVAGAGCMKPQHTVCDQASTVSHGDSCICRYQAMTQSAPDRCMCPQGSTLEPGRGCVPVCHDPMVLNRTATACECPEGTKLKNGKCKTKRSFLDNIFNNVHVGAGGGSQHGGGTKPTNPDTDNTATPRGQKP